MSFPKFLATCGILVGLFALVQWRKLPKKSEAARYWAYIGLAVAVIGTISVSVLRYLDGKNYYGLILLADAVWTGGAAICIAIGLCKVYQDRQMPHRKISLWVGTACFLGATAAMCYYCYHFMHFLYGG